MSQAGRPAAPVFSDFCCFDYLLEKPSNSAKVHNNLKVRLITHRVYLLQSRTALGSTGGLEGNQELPGARRSLLDDVLSNRRIAQQDAE